MLAQAGQTMGVADQIETNIRSYVGRFIAGRATITKLQQSPDLQVQSQANKLMTTQLGLEKDLDKATSLIPNIKAGAYTFGDLLWLGNFGRQLTAQVKSVDNLAKGLKSEAGMNRNTLIFLSLTTVVGLGMMWWKNRRV